MYLQKREYLQSFRGQRDRYKYRSDRRVTIAFQCTLKSKKATSEKDKAHFQRTIMGQLKEIRRRAFRRDVAISIEVNSTQKDPPHIHTLTKNVLDMLGRPLAEASDRLGLLFYDDKQIKYLAVQYSFNNSEDHILIQAAPFRDFLEDLNLACKILMNRFDDQPDARELKKSLAEDDDDLSQDEHLDEFRTMSDEREWRIKLMGPRVFEKLLEFYRTAVQDDFIRIIMPKLLNLHLFFKAKGFFLESGFDEIDDLEKKSAKTLADWLLEVPLSVKLPEMPLNAGESKRFKREVLETLKAYKAKHEILTPLYYPIILDAIFKPPKTNFQYSKDLDNIMRLVIPLFNEVFNPPTVPEAVKVGDFAEYYRFPKSIKNSIIGFDIVEIPRTSENESGSLTVSISRHKMMTQTIWERIDEVIHQAVRNYHDED